MRQSEILSDVIQRRQSFRSLAEDSEPEIESIAHPFAMVVTQDCDLEQDYYYRASNAEAFDETSAKIVPNVLFLIVITAEELYGQTRTIGSDIWRRVKKNQDQRYHFLQKVDPSCDALSKGLPEMGIDFKRYFTVPTDELYKMLSSGVNRRCVLNTPYLEHLSIRFNSYQSRVALPQDHVSE